VCLNSAPELSRSVPFGLFTPRAAHALAATLVQITNAIANTAIMKGTNTAASQVI